MKSFITRTLPLILLAVALVTPVHAGSAISFIKFNDVFGYKSKYSEAEKDKLIKKLRGKTVEWEGKLSGKFFHFSQVSLSLDMGDFAGPRYVNVILKSSEKEKLRKITPGSIVKVRGKIEAYGKVKFHELENGIILEYKLAKNGKEFDPRSIRYKKLNE